MIPRLLLEREAAKKKEISERESINVEEATMGVLTEEERKELTENEYELMHRHTLQDPTNLLGVRDDDGRVRDPHVKARVKELKHEEWREIEIGPYDLLKDGQMVMVSVCDPFDAEKFHPTDKIVVAKINGNYHATGAFCGFDYTPLAKGALIGSRIICPTCTSTYNMQTGFIEQGPTLRHISTFTINTRGNRVNVTMPEHVPAFQLRESEKMRLEPRTFVVLGDSEAALSAIDSLKQVFAGKIIVITQSPFGMFENIDVLRRKMRPLTRNEVYYVDEDFFDRNEIDLRQNQVEHIDVDERLLYLKGEKKPLEYDRILIAWGSHKAKLEKQYSNAHYLEDRHAHAKCHNELVKANKIVVLGKTLEAYQVAASTRDYLDSIGRDRVQITLLQDGKDEMF